MDLGLRGKACIVTGGSRGIGYAVAERLREEGASLMLVARDGDALAQAEERLGGRNICTLAIDVTADGAAEQITRRCCDHFGRIDVLVNNAGGTADTPMDELTDCARPTASASAGLSEADEDWRSQWQVHVEAPMRLMRSAAPIMAQSGGGGRIVNVASSSGRRPSSQNPAYGVAKSGQLALSRAFAEHWAPRGVLVNAVAPGPAKTELWTGPGGLGEQVAERTGRDPQEIMASFGAALPIGRMAEVGEIADVCVFLCSARVSNVVGAVWSADGGAVRTIL